MKKKKIFLHNILRQIILVHCGQTPSRTFRGKTQNCCLDLHILTVKRTKTEGKKKKQNTQRNIFKKFYEL